MAQTAKRLPTMRETRVRSLGWEDPVEKEMATPLQYSCLGESHSRKESDTKERLTQQNTRVHMLQLKIPHAAK